MSPPPTVDPDPAGGGARPSEPPAPARDPAPVEVSCPQCGGANVPEPGERLLTCVYCGAALFLDRSGVVLHYWVARRLTAEDARGALRRWMAGNRTVKDLDTRSTVEAVVPWSFPVWMFRFTEHAGKDSRTGVRTEPASAPPVPDLLEMEIPVGELSPRDPEAEAGPVHRPEISVPLERARGWLDEAGGTAASPERRVEETALVHVPLWHATYRYGGETYTALVDGSTGRVFASRYPAKAEAPYAAMLIGGVALLLIEGFLVGNPLLRLGLLAVTAIPLFLLAYLVVRNV